MSSDKLDLDKWAVVGNKDDGGFTRQVTDIRNILGIGYHLVIPSGKLSNHPLTADWEKPLDPSLADDELKATLSGLQGLIYPERPWHPRLLPVARELGIKTVCLPNWEWFKSDDPGWKLCDLLICQTQMTFNVVSRFGWKNAVYIPLTLDMSVLPVRQIAGLARLFIHNAGIVDAVDRKGTCDTILAFKKVKRQDIKLIVRLQNEVSLPDPDERIEIRMGSLSNSYSLYTEGDVIIQPSKMEGIGRAIAEPFTCGIPVITLDYPPMNEFIRTAEMLVRKRWFKRRAFPTPWVKHAHLRLPDINDLARKIEWCAANDMAAISQFNRQEAEKLFNPDFQRGQWLKALSTLFA